MKANEDKKGNTERRNEERITEAIEEGKRKWKREVQNL